MLNLGEYINTFVWIFVILAIIAILFMYNIVPNPVKMYKHEEIKKDEPVITPDAVNLAVDEKLESFAPIITDEYTVGPDEIPPFNSLTYAETNGQPIPYAGTSLWMPIDVQ